MSSVLLLGSIVLGQLETRRRQQWETRASAPDSWGRATARVPGLSWNSLLPEKHAEEGERLCGGASGQPSPGRVDVPPSASPNAARFSPVPPCTYAVLACPLPWSSPSSLKQQRQPLSPKSSLPVLVTSFFPGLAPQGQSFPASAHLYGDTLEEAVGPKDSFPSCHPPLVWDTQIK